MIKTSLYFNSKNRYPKIIHKMVDMFNFFLLHVEYLPHKGNIIYSVLYLSIFPPLGDYILGAFITLQKK